MVPRVDIIAIEIDTPFADAVKQLVEHGHSRVPVYRETLDDVVGIVHIKDLLPYAADGKPVPLGKLVRKVLFVAPSMPLLDLLAADAAVARSTWRWSWTSSAASTGSSPSRT